ncbi:2Fe-2S iron-sulfur cluster-binding protein [Nioella aestuarii]|uniref:2Fe-2S iron-sulfur cluster-binding protein n=1 Tax=Nioella aestuarii TaxID=1662864 RepID=UPI003D7F2120
MPKITFVEFDGTKTTVDAQEGESVMSVAVANGIDAVVAECGGSMMCATCHCYVDDAWAEKTGERMDGEDDMLECAASELRETSRLSCQIKITDELDGLIVHLPEDQI